MIDAMRLIKCLQKIRQRLDMMGDMKHQDKRIKKAWKAYNLAALYNKKPICKIAKWKELYEQINNLKVIDRIMELEISEYNVKTFYIYGLVIHYILHVAPINYHKNFWHEIDLSQQGPDYKTDPDLVEGFIYAFTSMDRPRPTLI